MKKNGVIRKRKHRNGVRPTRKGSLKVRIIELPDSNDFLWTTADFLVQLNDAVISLCNLEYGPVQDREWEWELYHAKKRNYDLMKNGYSFLSNYRQVAPAGLAACAINDVDPAYYKLETMDEKCARCPLSKDCSFKCYRDEEHRFRWCHMGTGAKFLGSTPKELTQHEMATIALQHLS